MDERGPNTMPRRRAARCGYCSLLLALVGGCAGSGRVLERMPQPIRVTRASPAPIQRDRAPQIPAPRPDVIRPERVATSWHPPHGIDRSKWEYIVVHHSATSRGGASAFDRYHRQVNQWDELGYHFVIGNGSDTGDGQIEVGSRWTKQKWGAHCKVPGNHYNEHGIGICLVGDFELDAPSDAQMASLSRLVAFLMSECGIPPDHVVGHGSVTGKTACPGRHFPMGGLQRDVGQRLSANY